MKITAKVEVYCASGFYCAKNGDRKCSKMRYEGNRPYCDLFYPYLATDKDGNVLKCESCLLAEREERLKR